MKRNRKRIAITLLAVVLVCTGCGNAAESGDSQRQKENAEETAGETASPSKDIPQESESPNLPEEGEVPEDITNLPGNAASDEENEDTDRAVLSQEAVPGMREDAADGETVLETNPETQPIYEITDGNTGKQITLNDSLQLECMDALLEDISIQREESIQSDAERPMGYLYRIRVLNENGDVSKTITLNGNRVEIDGKYYAVESTEDLVAYLDGLYQ